MADGDFGARGKGSYELTRFNALRHGILSKHAVLPWEDRSEYDQLLGALIAEHKPKGPTQELLVEELAIIFWRKARLCLAEQAAHFRALQRTTADERRATREAALVLVTTDLKGRRRGEAITDAQRVAAMKALQDDETKARDALNIVRKGKTERAYSQALATLSKEDQASWHQSVAKSRPYETAIKNARPPQPQDLENYIENDILRKYGDRRIELEHHELIKEQSFGEAVDPHALEALARYEVNLDRKMGKTLTMLFKLKELSSNVDAE